MEILIAKKYKIIKKLSQGSFGQIFHAININSGQQLAIKLQKIDSKYPQIIHQAKVVNALLNNSTITDKGIPNMYFSGKQGDYNALVMDLLGPSLQQLLQKNAGTFTTKTTLMLFMQMVKRIEYIHSRQFLHRDIKPENFLMGRDQRKQKVFIIDFGLSKKFIKDNNHIQYAEGKSMVGTVRYASINTHLGIEPTRRDDLEALVYIVYYFLYGRLPWQGLTGQTVAEKYNKILALKVESKPEVLFKNLPMGMREQMTEIFQYIRGLKFDQKPNYELIKVKIREALTNLGHENDFLFDWSQHKAKSMTTHKGKSLMKVKTIAKNTHSGMNTPLKQGMKLGNSVDMKSDKKKGEEIKTREEETLEQTLSRLKAVKTPLKKY